MNNGLFCLYSCILGIGSALIGLVIGFMIVRPSAAIASILVAIGIGFLAVAILMARGYRRRNRRADTE